MLALLWTGGHPSKEAQSLLEQIRDIDGDFEFETYYSLSCHNCPDVVQALNLMAVLNPRIKHTAIDGGTFQNEITERNVMGCLLYTSLQVSFQRLRQLLLHNIPHCWRCFSMRLR